MSKKQVQAVNEILSTEETILRNVTEKCFTFLSEPPRGFKGEDRDAELRPLCGAIVKAGIKTHKDVINTLIKAAEASGGDDAAFGLVRRALTKLLNAATRELHFRTRVIEQKQQSWWDEQKQGDVTIGEIETYNVVPWEDEPYTVAEFYRALELLNDDVQAYNGAICNLLGWGDDMTDDFKIPFAYAPVNTEANMALPESAREYVPVFSLSEALQEMDRKIEQKAVKRKAAAKSMLDALTA